jgi:hypothetical protein
VSMRFVTRAKQGMHARRVYSAPTDRPGGVICDQRVMLNGFYAAKDYPEHPRRIRQVVVLSECEGPARPFQGSSIGQGVCPGGDRIGGSRGSSS